MRHAALEAKPRSSDQAEASGSRVARRESRVLAIALGFSFPVSVMPPALRGLSVGKNGCYPSMIVVVIVIVFVIVIGRCSCLNGVRQRSRQRAGIGLNVLFIAACGMVAFIRQAARLLRRYSLDLRRAVLVVAVRLSLSFCVGAQCSWYWRPYLGVSTIPADATPFIFGTRPDFRGATSFYEAVYNIFDPPPLRENYFEPQAGQKQ